MRNRSFFCLFLIVFLALLPLTVLASQSLPSQKITLSFDVAQNVLNGNSVLTLPPDTPLHLFFGNLKRVRATLHQRNEDLTLHPDSDGNLLLPAVPIERILRLSWQLTTRGQDSGGNLITADGITLTGFWHPVADRDMFFSLVATLPNSFSGITEAETLHTVRRGKTTVLEASYPHPLRSINFVAGPYRVLSRKAGRTTVYTYFFKEEAELAADYLDRAVKYIKRYEKLLGPFPFKRYSIVENQLPTGYGMPTFTLLGRVVVRLPFIKDTSLGHEILHSWFGNALLLDGSGNWCEGLTTYLADQSYSTDRGEGDTYRKNQLLRYQSFVHADNISALIDFQGGGDFQPMAQKMRAIGYDKGSMVFHMLRREVGDKLFFAALRQLYAAKKFSRIGWLDIETQFSKTAARDLSGFFGQWLLRRDVPQLAVEAASVEQQGGRSVLTFDLVQDNKAPYRLQVPVTVRTLTGEEMGETVLVSSLRQQVSLSLDSLPTELRIDPRFDVMRSLQSAEIHPAWMEFTGAAKKTVVLPAKEDMELYLPLIAELERSGCRLVKAAELKNSALTEGSFVFLGRSSHTQGLFAATLQPQKGFLLEVRKNPLNPDQVMVLVATSSTAETAKVVPKLRHYGKYSSLFFQEGRLREKKITPSANGIILPLLPPPPGMPVKQIQDFAAIIDDLQQSRVVYVGETHTDYGHHLLQLQVIQALYAKNPHLMIGIEMFPRSSQKALNNYVNGTVSDEREFLKNSQYFKVWGYDYRMYQDIIGYAKKNGIPLIGLNLDKDIVSTVFTTGATDDLSREQWSEVAAERDLGLPGYRKRLQAIHQMHGRSPGSPTAGFSGFLQAQAMWDETMAESIVMALKKNPDKKMVVLAGIGHVYKDSAIPPRVARRVEVRQSVLAADNGVDRGLEEGKQLDYLMFTPEVQLPPAGKIGVVLNEVAAKSKSPARVEIIQVSPHGKAGEAGLRAQDSIVAIDEVKVASVGDLKAALMNKAPGDTVMITVQRGNRVLNFRVELTDMDQAAMMLPPDHPTKKK